MALMMYDFTTMKNLGNWWESSDSVRKAGMSKASFVLQATQLFQRAVFFSLLNPQPNGAGFAGFMTKDEWDLSEFSGLELKVRGQGENCVYKIILRHNEDQPNTGSYSYEQFYTLVKNDWITVHLPFTKFEAYFRGALKPDAEPLNTSNITSIGIQIPGGVYSDFKQSGPSSLEMDFIKAY